MLRAINKPTGMVAFSIVWFGQLVSLIGSAMTQFALALWAWQETGAATSMALIIFFAFGPTVFLSPIAGALVDRWNRKFVMMLTDFAAGLSTIVLALLFVSGNLQLWHIYAAGAFAGAFQAFQWPAYSAAITMMVSKANYARANGMMALAESGSGIAAPLLAGGLIGVIGVGGVLLIDIVTFIFAIALLLVISVPQPETTVEGRTGRGSIWKESLYGFSYIWQRPSLLGLQLIFLGVNLISALSFGLLSPMILARTGEDAQALGIVLSATGLGGVAGGLLMSTWGGPKQRIHGVLTGMALSSVLGTAVMGIGQSLPVWLIGAFLASFFIPILNGSNQAIWQAKVAPDVQGRVFAVRRLIAQVCFPLGLLAAGPLADFVFEPAMQSEGLLATLFGGLVGAEPGAGMALMFVLSGVSGVIIALSGYLFSMIRDVETILPDHAVAVAR